MPKHAFRAGLLVGLALAACGPDARAGLFRRERDENGELKYGGLFLPNTCDPVKRGTLPLGPPLQYDRSCNGSPFLPSRWAHPSFSEAFCGHYVGGGGGGLCHQAGPRRHNDGTWGWDYVGYYVPRKLFLGWNYGRRFQGGDRYYTAKDPVEVFDVFSLAVPRLSR